LERRNRVANRTNPTHARRVIGTSAKVVVARVVIAVVLLLRAVTAAAAVVVLPLVAKTVARAADALLLVARKAARVALVPPLAARKVAVVALALAVAMIGAVPPAPLGRTVVALQGTAVAVAEIAVTIGVDVSIVTTAGLATKDLVRALKCRPRFRDW